jgi:hypothetical protein
MYILVSPVLGSIQDRGEYTGSGQREHYCRSSEPLP